jgi:mono/diheme cytochrome c family protein
MTRWLGAGALALALVGCNGQGRWPATMEQQAAVQPLSEARAAPPGSIPLGGVETLDDRDDVTEAQSPFPLDAAAAARGAKTFATHCVPCHGPQARGDGPVSDKFPQAPNLRHYSICGRSDGYLYGTLTAGGRAMPTQREGLTSAERWDLVAHIRALQKEGCTGVAPGSPAPAAPPPAAPTPSGGTP